MRLHVADHPLVAHKLTVLRNKETASPTFRLLVDELVTLLAYEATREVATEPHTISTPVAETIGTRIADPRPLVVPILRAGLGMLDGMTRLLPTAEVGFLGMQRNEETLEAVTYANRLPDDLTGRQCFLVDPMLATGGTLVAAIDFLLKAGRARRHRRVPARRTRGPRGPREGRRRPRGREGGRRCCGRAPGRERVHHPGARGRRGPPVRRGRLTVDPTRVFAAGRGLLSEAAARSRSAGRTHHSDATGLRCTTCGPRRPAPRIAPSRRVSTLSYRHLRLHLLPLAVARLV